MLDKAFISTPEMHQQGLRRGSVKQTKRCPKEWIGERQATAERIRDKIGTLHGHVARANSQWKTAKPGEQALAMFLGPNTYVTPFWYPTKQQTGKVVPTWNYIAIHAYGEISFFDDPAQLRDHVGKLTEKHEGPRTSPWAVTDAPAEYVDKMLEAIVGFHLVITRLEGKWKMSQNRSPQDIAGVREGLVREDGTFQKAVADIMASLGFRYRRNVGGEPASEFHLLFDQNREKHTFEKGAENRPWKGACCARVSGDGDAQPPLPSQQPSEIA